MKNTFTLIVLFIGTLTFSQTKQETIDWINSKVPKDQIVYGDAFPHSSKMKINKDGSFVITTTYYKTPMSNVPTPSTILTITGFLKDFNLETIRVITEGNNVFIALDCYNKAECIKVNKVGEGGFSNSKTGVSFGAFDGFEKNIEERLKKAFKHLIVLYGGKKEKF